MSNFQQSINYDFAFGVPGEIGRDGPLRARPGYLNSGSAANNAFGRVFTLNADGKTVGAGGTGSVWGILANPKQHVAYGANGNALDPSFTLPNNTTADFVEMGKIIVPLYGSVAAVNGLQVQFSQSNGQISLPAVPGTADSGNTLLAAVIESYGQTAQGGALVLLKANI